MSGKGSGRRPQLVEDQVVEDAWNNIFAKKVDTLEDDEVSDYLEVEDTTEVD